MQPQSEVLQALKEYVVFITSVVRVLLNLSMLQLSEPEETARSVETPPEGKRSLRGREASH